MSNRFLSSAIFSGLTMALATAGEVVTDGSMGAAQTLTGPNYTIGQDLGTTVGNNLFHSFGTFNLSQGDIATFTGANTIQNVISQVTDGNPSSIDGTIHSQVGTANFFFINPAGMIFGQHAAIDVPAAFHASTANELRFADGSSYNLHSSKVSLTAAAPESFGFLGRTGDIVIEGSQLKFKEGTEVSFTGNSVTSNGATIEVPRGSLVVYGNGDTVSNVPINGELPSGNGAITMNGGNWNVNGDGGGDIWISGGAVSVINKAKIYNRNDSILDATGDIRIDANTLLIDSGDIQTDAFFNDHAGKGGNVTVNVNGEMLVQNGGLLGSATNNGIAGNVVVNAGNLIIKYGSLITSQTYGKGNAGNVSVNVAGNIQLMNAGSISSNTYSKGNAGNVTVVANNLTVDGINSSISSQTRRDLGNSGNIDINVRGEIRVTNNANVLTDSYGLGNAGNINITAGSLIVDGGSGYAGIRSSSNNGQSLGISGKIVITVTGNMIVINRGMVSTDTFSLGNAGNIRVTAKNLVVGNNSRISSAAYTGSKGDAGDVYVDVNDSIMLVNGGRISSSSGEVLASGQTTAQGKAGNVIVTAKNLTIDGQESDKFTGITSRSTQYSVGNAGTVVVSINRLIRIISNGMISTSAQTGTGGDITITAPAIVLNNSQITTSVTGAGKDGGDITLNGGYLVLDTGFIQANTVGDDAKGGDIFVNMDGVLPNGGVTIVGGEHRDFIPHSGQNVIQAAANATENDGTITITNPSDSSAAGLTGAANRLEPMQIAKNPCIGIKKRASLRRKGRGALLKSSLKSDLLKTNDYAPNSKDVTHTNRKQRQQEVCAEG